MDYAFRLERGSDLRESIETYFKDHNIHNGCIVTCVGCVLQATLRLADGVTVIQLQGRYEIVSLTGTYSEDGGHFHIALSDEQGQCIGGHLCMGTVVNTTAEIVIRSLDDRYRFSREYDANTGYDELKIKDR